MQNTFHEHHIMISHYENATYIIKCVINNVVVWIHMLNKCHINSLVSLTLILIIELEKYSINPEHNGC